MFRLSIFIVLFISSISLSFGEAKNSKWAGSVMLLTDFDGTLVNELNSPWKPYYILEKVRSFHSSVQYTKAFEKLPLRFPITIEEYYQMEHLLGWSEKIKPSKPITLKKDIALPDRPLSIIPSYYTINEESSYERFRKTPDRNFLLEDLSYALERQKVSRKNFYGMTYETASWIMKNPSLGYLSIHTARSQDYQDFNEFFNQLLKTGGLQQLKFQVHPLNGPKSRDYGKNLLERKEGVVDLGVRHLHQIHLKKEGEGFLHINKQKALNLEKEQKHILVVAEDHPEYAHALYKKTRQASQENFYKNSIKFIFIHAGKMEYVKDGNRIVVFDNGFPRLITDIELKEELNMSTQAIKRFGINYATVPKRIVLNQKSNTKTQKNLKKKTEVQKTCKSTFKGKAS